MLETYLIQIFEHMLPFPAPKFIKIADHSTTQNVFSLRKAHILKLQETQLLIFLCLHQYRNISKKDEDWLV
jgi:hypothetical protein